MHNVHSEFRSDFTLYVRTVPDLGCVNKTMHVDNVGVAPEYYDNHLLIVDEENYRIQMFTIYGGQVWTTCWTEGTGTTLRLVPKPIRYILQSTLLVECLSPTF